MTVIEKEPAQAFSLCQIARKSSPPAKPAGEAAKPAAGEAAAQDAAVRTTPIPTHTIGAFPPKHNPSGESNRDSCRKNPLKAPGSSPQTSGGSPHPPASNLRTRAGRPPKKVLRPDSALSGTPAELRARLRELISLKKEIAHDRARLAQLENRLRGNPAGLPPGADPSLFSGYRAAVAENLERCCRLYEAVQRAINAIDDSEMRRIFTLYYINGWSWQRVAFAVGLNSEASARLKHNRYLAAMAAPND